MRTLEAVVLQQDDLPAKCVWDRNGCEEQFARMMTALLLSLVTSASGLIIHAKEGSKGLMIKSEEMTDNTELLQRN